MIKYSLFFLSLLITIGNPFKTEGQNFNFSQYDNTSGLHNPSRPSLVQEAAVRLNYRVQAAGGRQAMTSAVLNASYPWLATRSNGPTSSIGLMLLDDKVAPANGLSFQSVGLSLSYAFSLSKYQRLSFGLMPTYGMHRMDHEGMRTISQYSAERGYSPSLPLNEPLLNARGSFLAWNAGASWLQQDRKGNPVSSAGLSLNNINRPQEVFQDFENTIPFAVQAFFFTKVYEDRLFTVLPEIFFSSYGSSYQVQPGGILRYNLRYSSFRQGHLNFISRYNLLRSMIFGARLEQPGYEIGLSTDLYMGGNSPFSQAFELSFALKRGIEGRNFNRKKRKKDKKNESSSRGKKERLVAKREKKENTPPVVAERKESIENTTEQILKEIPSDTTSMVSVKEITEAKNEEEIFNEGQIILGSAAKKIQFKVASANLLPQAEEALGEVAEYLRLNPDFRILITGHTDDTGGPSLNLRLSKERAKAVKSFLKSKGVDDNQISTAGAGMERPLLPNTSDENRLLNRRVEFLLYKE